MNDKCTFCPAEATAIACGVPVCPDCNRIFFGERGSGLGEFLLIVAGCLIVTAFCILCLAASPRGIDLAWWVGLLGGG